jgi:hypothetical protein
MQVQRLAWEAIKQGYQEAEKQISRETILNVIIVCSCRLLITPEPVA